MKAAARRLVRYFLAGWTSDRILSLTVDYMHTDLREIRERLQKFDKAPTSVQRAVIARLDQLVSFHEVGHLTAGASALVAGSVGILAALAAISVSGYSGLLNMLTKLTDEKTGRIAGVTSAHLDSIVHGIIAPIGVAAAVVLCLLLTNIWFAHWRDGRRATATAWRNLYVQRWSMRTGTSVDNEVPAMSASAYPR